MKLLKPVWISHGTVPSDTSFGRPIYSLDLHPDGSRLATGGLIDTCGVIILWNMAPIRNHKLETDGVTPRKLFQMDSHQACVNCVRWSPSGRWLASAGMDKVIMLWKKTAATSRHTTVFGSKEQTTFTEHWRCASVLRGHNGDIIDLAWSHDGCKLASAGVDNTIMVWCLQTQPNGSGIGQFVMLASLKGHQGFVKGVAWDPVGRYLASQGDEISVKVWRTADWKEEVVIKNPFVGTVGQSQAMRMSWSLDGSTLAAPHAINNGFPTAKLIDRTNWLPAFDLVGHRKHVICARYCPNLFRKSVQGEVQDLVCLALGSKDRSVSVWTTSDRRALVVIQDLFTNSVCDLTWSSNGTELMACSLDGTVSYMEFTNEELGTPWSISDLVHLHHKSYGQSLLDGLVSCDAVDILQDPKVVISMPSSALKSGSVLEQSDIILETPEALALQQLQADVVHRLNTAHQIPPVSVRPKVAPRGPSNQIETRGKDGRRRIIPKFLGHLDDLDDDGNSNPQFTSPQSSQHSKSTPMPEETDLGKFSDTPKLNGFTEQAPVSLNNLDHPVHSSTVKPAELLAEKQGDVSKQLSTPPSCAMVSLESPISAQIDGTNQRKRGFASVDAEPCDQHVDEDTRPKSVATLKLKKRRRVRLFDDNDELADKPSSQSKGVADLVTTYSSPRSRISAATDADTAPPHADQSPSVLPRVPPVVVPSSQLANETKVKFVCSDSVDGLILIELGGHHTGQTPGQSHRPHPGTRDPPGIYRVIAYRNDKLLWERCSECKLTAYAYTDQLIVIGDTIGRIELLYVNGIRACPPLVLDSSVHLLSLTPLSDEYAPNDTSTSRVCNAPGSTVAQIGRLHTIVSGLDNPDRTSAFQHNSVRPYRLIALCNSGRLVSWRINIPSHTCTASSIFSSTSLFPQLLVQTNVSEVLKGSPSSPLGFSSLTFCSEGHPVVHRRDGSSYLFHMESRLWFELFDGSSRTQCASAIHSVRNCPPGPLASCQLLHKVVGSSGLRGKFDDSRCDNFSPDQRLIVQRFLEAQTQNARLFGSSTEFRYWFQRWFRHLVEDSQEEGIRRICHDLIGPVFSGSRSAWEPTIKNISKHDLMRELLSFFALNLRLQRLYVELKETLDQCQSNRS